MAPLKTSLVDVLKIGWLLLKIQIYHKEVERHRTNIQVKGSSRHL